MIRTEHAPSQPRTRHRVTPHATISLCHPPANHQHNAPEDTTTPQKATAQLAYDTPPTPLRACLYG
jgi:hypothetical protein